MALVAVDGRMFLGQMHGLARYCFSLVSGLAQIRGGLDLAVLERRGAFAGRLDPGIRRVPLSAPPLGLREQWEVPLCLRKLSAQLYHATCIAVPRYCPCPLVVTVADLIPLHLPRHPVQRLYRLYFEGVLGPVCRRARAIVVHSQATGRDVIASLKVEPERVHYCPLGVESYFHPRSSRYSQLYPEGYFVCVANPKPHKNVALLLDAFGRMRGPQRLVLVCPEAPWLAERLRRLPRAERMFPLQEQELAELLAGALALVFPSYFEGFGLPALEAMACGTPVIAADATSLPEVVGDGGWLFPPHDSRALQSVMERVAGDAAHRQRAAQRAVTRAAAFTWDKTVRFHLSVYQNALS